MVATQGVLGGVEPGHAVDATSRRGGRRSSESWLDLAWHTGKARREPTPRSERKSCRPPLIAPPTRLGLSRLQIGGSHHVAGQDAIAEAGCKTLELLLDAVRHVDVRASRHVAIGPEGLLSGRCTGGIKEARLADEEERAIGVTTPADLPLGLGDLLQRAADMDRAGVETVGSGPGHGAIERVVDLEDSRSVAMTVEVGAIAGGEPRTGDRRQLSRIRVEEHDGRQRKVVPLPDASSRESRFHRAPAMRRRERQQCVALPRRRSASRRGVPAGPERARTRP